MHALLSTQGQGDNTAQEAAPTAAEAPAADARPGPQDASGHSVHFSPDPDPV